MQKTKRLAIAIGILFCLLFCSCASEEVTDVSTEPSVEVSETTLPEGVKHVVTSTACVTPAKSMGEFIDKADFIVLCTVEEIGDSFLWNHPTIQPENTKAVSMCVNDIRTPVMLHIHKAFLDKIGIENDTLTILLYQGIYGEYMLTDPYPTYELGHTYLLFIGQAPDGETNIVIPHGSVEIDLPEAMPLDANEAEALAIATGEGTSFTHMFYGSSFDGMDSVAELFDAVEAEVEKLGRVLF